LPILKSSKKRMRTSEKRCLQNQMVRSRVKTYLKKARIAVDSGDEKSATEALQEAYSALDAAARKGVIHRNTAARKKSRLARHFNRRLSSRE